VADAYETDEDVALTVEAPGVLANDTDADGDALTAVLDTDVSHGTLTLSADGSFSYTPDASYNGPDGFTYHASDGEARSSTVLVTLTVNAVNDAPTADVGGPYTGEAGLAVAFDGTGSSDVDGNVVSYTWDFGDGATGTGATPTHVYATAGTYTVTLTVTDDGTPLPAQTSAPSVTTATIGPNPGLVVSPATLTFVAQHGADPIPNRQSFTVTNVSDAPIRWRAEEDSTWLSIQSPTGVLDPGETETVSVTVVGVGSLPPGTLEAVITVADRDGAGVQATVTVIVTVLAQPAPIGALHPAGSGRR
jgi:VCBS repeat-containing protein